jgi:hypothetical protein
MRTTIFATIALALLLVACKRENTEAVPQGSSENTQTIPQKSGESTVKVVPQAPGSVSFPAAGVSIDVSTGWKRVDVNPGLPFCPPGLVGRSGVIQTVLLAPSITDMRAATNAIWARYHKRPGSVKNSFHQENFTSDSGLQGDHISYNAAQTEKSGTVTKLQIHNFIVQKQNGHCVVISYITTAETDSSGVCQMIEKSLKLQ